MLCTWNTAKKTAVFQVQSRFKEISTWNPMGRAWKHYKCDVDTNDLHKETWVLLTKILLTLQGEWHLNSGFRSSPNTGLFYNVTRRWLWILLINIEIQVNRRFYDITSCRRKIRGILWTPNYFRGYILFPLQIYKIPNQFFQAASISSTSCCTWVEKQDRIPWHKIW